MLFLHVSVSVSLSLLTKNHINNLVKLAISKMKSGKSAGPPGIVAEMLTVSGKVGINLITNLVKLYSMSVCRSFRMGIEFYSKLL